MVLSLLPKLEFLHYYTDINISAIHDQLKTEPAVADYFFSHPELGGFGRTEVVLR